MSDKYINFLTCEVPAGNLGHLCCPWSGSSSLPHIIASAPLSLADLRQMTTLSSLVFFVMADYHFIVMNLLCIGSLLDFCWLFAFVFSFGCVYLSFALCLCWMGSRPWFLMTGFFFLLGIHLDIWCWLWSHVTLVMHVPPKNATSSPVGHHSIRRCVLQGPVPKWNKCSQLWILRWNCILGLVPPRNMWISVRHHAIRDHGSLLPGSVPVFVRYWLLNVPAGAGIWYRYWVLLTTFIPVLSCYGVQDWFLVRIRQISLYIYMWYWDLYKTGRRL
jgi:hypothetical protein